tara:strand:- start:3033 stop:5699 length:2667 start_codon:yes stop_codon:yes gene_type:complete
MINAFSLNNFHPQAYLLFLSFAKKTLKKNKIGDNQYENLVYKLTGPYKPQAVMSKVYNAKDSSGKRLIKAHFFNLETHKISALVPEVRFFKAEGDVYEPFYFPISAIADDAASSIGNSRLKGAGIKDFSVDFKGTDPFTAPKFLDSGLTLYVDNLSNLFEKEPGYAPLADLFTISIAKSALKKESGGATLSSGDFSRPIEVVATLGYVVPHDRMGIFTKEEVEEIQSTNLSIRMNVRNHDISVNQDGSATIKVDYTARIDNLARNKVYSAVDAPIDLLKRANIRQLFSPSEKQIDSTGKKNEEQALKTVRKSQLRKSMEIREIMNILERTNRIYKIQTKFDDDFEYQLLGEGNEITDKPPESSDSPPEEQLDRSKAAFEKALRDLDNSIRDVHYVTFGDLVEAFLRKTRASLEQGIALIQKSTLVPSNIQKKKPEEKAAIAKKLGVNQSELLDMLAFKEKTTDERQKIAKVLQDAIRKTTTFKVLMADVEYKHYKQRSFDEDVARINIADIPISLELYQQFMFDKIINSHRNTYTIPQFLNDCVSQLLPKAFGKDWSNTGIAAKVIAEAPKFTSTTYSGPSLRNSLKRKKELNPESIPAAQKDFKASNIKDEDDYFVIYQAVDRALATERRGNIDEDSKDGIYHFILGKDRGLIKEINFSRFDVPFAQEQLMTNQVGLYDELRMPYSANINMIGNNLFIPGSQIFINPNNIGLGSATDLNSPAFRIGLGGYYTVLEVSTNFDGSTLSTTLNCSFGAHAKESEGLTSIAAQVKQIDEIKKDRESNDQEGDTRGAQDAVVLDVSQAQYYEQLRTLKNRLTGQRVVDDAMAAQISNDYIVNKKESKSSIPGVTDKSYNVSSGAVRYNLQRGQIIEINDSKPSREVVSLVGG